MGNRAFDALTRRASLLSLGVAGVGALAGPPTADAKKSKKSKIKKKARQKCQNQAGQCLAFLSVSCGNDTSCVASAQRCCPLVGNCDFAGFVACLAAN
jgi:hypothetical protein